MSEKARMTRQIRVFNETAALIEAIIKRSPAGTTFAEIVEDWARKLYPQAYQTIISTMEELDNVLLEEGTKAE